VTTLASPVAEQFVSSAGWCR